MSLDAGDHCTNCQEKVGRERRRKSRREGEAENTLMSFARWAAQNWCVLEQGFLDVVDAAPSVMKPGVSRTSPKLPQIAPVGLAGQRPDHSTLSRNVHYVVYCSTCCKGNRGTKIKRPPDCVPRFRKDITSSELMIGIAQTTVDFNDLGLVGSRSCQSQAETGPPVRQPLSPMCAAAQTEGGGQGSGVRSIGTP